MSPGPLGGYLDHCPHQQRRWGMQIGHTGSYSAQAFLLAESPIRVKKRRNRSSPFSRLWGMGEVYSYTIEKRLRCLNDGLTKVGDSQRIYAFLSMAQYPFHWRSPVMMQDYYIPTRSPVGSSPWGLQPLPKITDHYIIFHHNRGTIQT